MGADTAGVVDLHEHPGGHHECANLVVAVGARDDAQCVLDLVAGLTGVEQAHPELGEQRHEVRVDGADRCDHGRVLVG